LQDNNNSNQIPNFSKNRYELVFAIFMFTSAFFFYSNPDVKYPEVLYPFLALMIVNFISNRYLKNKIYVNIYFVLSIILINMLLGFLIMNLSGGLSSYFWVLLLLPIFTVSMTGITRYFWATSLFIFVGFIMIYLNQSSRDIFSLGIMFIENFIIIGGGYVIYRQVKTRYLLEKEIISKRKEVNDLLAQINLKNSISHMNRPINNTEFMSTAIHDIKNLITIIDLTADLMGRENNENQTDLARIKYASKMAANILSYTLSVTRSDNIEMDVIDINNIINDVNDIVKLEFELNKIKIVINNKLTRSKIMGNKLFLTRAILNILLNSRSAVPKHNGHIEIDLKNDDSNISIVISDNGPGFPKEIIDKIEPYKSTRIKVGGTGLGLFSTYEIVRKLNGSLRIYNNNGAVCEITLPLLKE